MPDNQLGQISNEYAAAFVDMLESVSEGDIRYEVHKVKDILPAEAGDDDYIVRFGIAEQTVADANFQSGKRAALTVHLKRRLSKRAQNIIYFDYPLLRVIQGKKQDAICAFSIMGSDNELEVFGTKSPAIAAVELWILYQEIVSAITAAKTLG